MTYCSSVFQDTQTCNILLERNVSYLMSNCQAGYILQTGYTTTQVGLMVSFQTTEFMLAKMENNVI